MRMTEKFKTSRRAFLALAAAGGAAATLPGAEARAQQVPTNARIVIIGAGAAGTALVNRLVERLDGAQITLIDPRARHLYQPGLTLVAAGLKPADYVVSTTTEWMPDGVTLIEDAVSAVDPEVQRVETEGGETVDYDFLVLAPGLILDHGAIEGFSRDMIGTNGIGALYGGPEDAAATWAAAAQFVEEGGKGLFTRPATEMKCAGAPLKHTFLIDDRLRRADNRGAAEILYAAPQTNLFGVPIVAERVRMLFGDRDIEYSYQRTLRAIDSERKIATFDTPDGTEEQDYDYIHIIPPQRAPQFIRDSGLSWADRWTDQGWVDCDQYTMRHNRYDNIWAVGDVAGVPKGKTAASVKFQVPVVEDHLVAAIQGQEGTATYGGYTSCPMITRIGRAMLIEFDYNNNLTPSFPGVIAPLEELWISWLMKEIALKATYNAMLRGQA
ncbi:Oxidoreductase (flavoprotein) [Roseibacterium elongatum DSM 19469]|uniref:Oxidoreductase (Flavoprotein) n=1 Tax=Roseicyclus elongatus DSM 19469 TaxID=1294273 RepID=W8SR86_9RHOB|nr:FAD/NAD(P)-binding oxidoreductase [Roseibacterium elongatum]AHM05035.1 Oxidoreductase (flavoprotein) [Roseibacterium elongatum DSM 19469]